MRILILGGAGAMGSETTKDIMKTSDFSEIVIGDVAIERTRKFVSKLNDERLSVIKIDASNIDELVDAMKGFDVVACALPFKYDVNVTQACVRAKVDGIDLSSKDEQFALYDKAKRAGITYVAGCGATPGTTNLMVKYGISKLESAEKVQIAFAAFRCTAIAPGLLYTTFWEFDPEVEERVYYEDGEFVRVRPLEGAKAVEFHEQIGKQEVVYVPHSETRTLPKTFPELKKVEVRGCFPPRTMELIRMMVKYGFFQKQPIEVNNKEVKPVDFMFSFLLQNPEAKRNPIWAYGLIVEVEGQKDGKPARITLKNSHPQMDDWGGKSAYGKNVGIPLSIGAQMIAKGKVKRKGVFPPEASLDPAEFFNELSKRRITIHERMERHIG